MDPRDPRHPGNDHPPADAGWGADLPPAAPRREEELTERYGPPAPEPAWEKSAKPPFDREKFLLFCVAWVIGVQYAIYIVTAGTCAYLSNIVIKTKLGPSIPWTPGSDLPFCEKLPEDMQKSAEGSLAVLLALLGGSAMAAGEMQRRRQDNNDPRNPGR